MLEKRTIDISTGIIFRTILVLLGIWFIYVVRDVIEIFFIAVIFTASIAPIVDWLENKKIPRSIGITFVFLVLFAIFGTIIYLLIPPLIVQFRDFVVNLPSYGQKLPGIFKGLENYADSYNFSFTPQDIFQSISGNLSVTSNKIFSTTIGVFSGFISAVIILSLTFYMSIKREGMKSVIVSLVPERHQDYAASLVERMKEKISRWMHGQLLLMAIIFMIDFIVLYIIGVPYALVFAIFGGLMEIIPYIGPIVSAIPPIIFGLLISPLTGFIVFVSYVVIHQIEGHIVVPQVMKKAVGLNPVIVILVLLIGAKVGGVLGAVLSVPLATMISVVVQDLFGKNSVLLEKNKI